MVHLVRSGFLDCRLRGLTLLFGCYNDLSLGHLAFSILFNCLLSNLRSLRPIFASILTIWRDAISAAWISSISPCSCLHLLLLNLIYMKYLSWMIVLTSFPTYPTSVYFVAYTLKNGASVNFASLLAISVFPHPVGPWISKFLGVIYVLISYGKHLRLHLFLKEIATALLASAWPMTNLSR